jgi:SpoVK/Ycf46/Vps4 family AAA+-type ATPase
MSLERASSIIDRFGVFISSLLEPVPEKPPPKAKNEEADWLLIGINLVYTLTVTTLSGYLLLYLTNRFSSLMTDPNDKAPSQGRVNSRLQKILQKRATAVSIPTLSHYELIMADEILDPDDIDVSFADIGGLNETKQEIYQLAVLPLLKPELFKGKLCQPTKGILLFGRPGTGKTMLAKAVAKEAEAVFLPLQLSKILSKWVGESNKLVAATFSLARKLQPAILFIDELDTFLKASSSETAYLDSIKAEFLTLWDGIGTSSDNRVLVLGATNKPQLIDTAILRRLPRTFPVPLPDQTGRQSILNLLLKDEPLSDSARNYIRTLAQQTVGYSGSDLKELCQAAAMVRVQEVTAEMSRRRVMGEVVDDDEEDEESKTLRLISLEDLQTGMLKVQRTGAVAETYGREESRDRADDDSLRDFATLLRNLTRAASQNSNDRNDDGIPDI